MSDSGSRDRAEAEQDASNMAANKQIVKSWHFWAGIIAGVALTLAALFLLGHLRPNEANETAGRADGEFANR